ncbi:phosphoserine phosphatase SerB [Geoglobus ahangari]|uniref:phosphoserine phosphatase n=1 Tax=Geoglobus ahangari TaxID=113653 RepID=A0A0F7IHF0_9EURY|nr:phosphoserine phosphatase SerB [Geoglobus ahangari]AKG92118.1 phosphoserine phosphatase SerB [Geoglobus ahangari]
MELLAVSVFGVDRPGIVFRITEVLAEANINIVDIEQNVIQGIFTMFIVGDISGCTLSVDEIRERLERVAEEIGVHVHLSPFEKTDQKEKRRYVITVIGKDRVGIVRDVSRILYSHGVNIEKTTLTARDQLISISIEVDMRDADVEEVKRRLKEEIEQTGLDVVIQPYGIAKEEKRLIVFDMDSTLIDAEIIDELAKMAGVEDEVRELTSKAMNGEIDFETALRERVKLLEGLPVEVMEKIYDQIKLTEGAKELIESLKKAGYKVALVSGGFTYFTEKLKNELGLDYAFGNELEIKDGKLTGRIKGKVITAEEKARIIEEIARKEGIRRENIVAVGDGANDRIMIERAGLGIAFNAKDALKEVADGLISKENLIGLASILKLPSEFKKRL